MSKVNTGQASSTLIPKYIGSDFDKVVAVADNIEQVVIAGDNIEDVGTVADNINYVKEVAEDLHGMPVTMYTGENPPVLNPMPEGVMWYCTTDGRTYVWYTDADSGQWVESAPQSAMKDEATNIFFHSTPSNVNPAYRNATLFSTSVPEAEISVAHNALNTPVVQAQFIREEALWVDVSVTGAQGIVTLMGYSSGNSQLKAEIITWKNGAEGTSLGASQWVTLPNQPSVVSLPVTLANIDVLDAGDSYVVKLTSQMNAGGSAVSTILVDGNTSSRFGIIFNTNLIGLNDGIRDGVTTSAPTENAVYDALQLKVGKSQLAQSGELIPVADWADVPAYSDSELGGLDGPLNAQAKALTARSELLITDVREALRRSYAEAGYNLVDGSFEAGGTLVNANDVLLQERTGKAFSGPAGTVAAGTNPASGGFVDKSGGLLRHELATSDGAAKVGNANGGSVQDFIDAQYSTVAELATGKFQVGAYVILTDRAGAKFNVVAGGTPNGFDIIDAGNGNTAVYSSIESYLIQMGSSSTIASQSVVNRAMQLVPTKIYQTENLLINGTVIMSPNKELIGGGDGTQIVWGGGDGTPLSRLTAIAMNTGNVANSLSNARLSDTHINLQDANDVVAIDMQYASVQSSVEKVRVGALGAGSIAFNLGKEWYARLSGCSVRNSSRSGIGVNLYTAIGQINAVPLDVQINGADIGFNIDTSGSYIYGLDIPRTAHAENCNIGLKVKSGFGVRSGVISGYFENNTVDVEWGDPLPVSQPDLTQAIVWLGTSFNAANSSMVLWEGHHYLIGVDRLKTLTVGGSAQVEIIGGGATTIINNTGNPNRVRNRSTPATVLSSSRYGNAELLSGRSVSKAATLVSAVTSTQFNIISELFGSSKPANGRTAKVNIVGRRTYESNTLFVEGYLVQNASGTWGLTVIAGGTGLLTASVDSVSGVITVNYGASDTKIIDLIAEPF